jgi:prepilin-type N-terminal cleavage/methylation domain-containing protein
VGGFTLIELLIAMSIFLIVLLGIYQMFDTNRATYVSGTRKVDVQQNARVALDAITRELRMAGYFPENYDTDLTTTPSLAKQVGILIATDNGLVVYGDLDGTCNPTQSACPASSSSVFLYCFDSISHTILRKRSTDVTVVASFSCSGGDVLAENIEKLQFTYYDGSNNPVPNPPNVTYALDGQTLDGVPAFDVNLPTPDVRTTIRTIVVTLVAAEAVPIPGQQPQRFTLTSSVRLRNIN